MPGLPLPLDDAGLPGARLEARQGPLRPDHETRWIFVQADPGAAQAWRKEPYYSQLKRWAAAGNRQVVEKIKIMAREPDHGGTSDLVDRPREFAPV